jgi:cob(I)alamin adenosyltransferase
MAHHHIATVAKNYFSNGGGMRQGLVTLFTGDGRGKTTAAVGTAVRAAGHGLRVLIVFFMKGPDFVHGETLALESVPGITTRSFGAHGWVVPGTDNTEHRLRAEEAFDFASSAVSSGSYDLIVLDEIIGAADFGLLSRASLFRFIEEKPSGLELIMTGRGAFSGLIDAADEVTEMKSIKHPYEKGIVARAGIDY